jgi:hypothetical protein
MAMVWELAVTPSEKLVLLALADHAQDGGGGAYPSVATLARKTGLSDRMVRYVLSRKSQQGLLSKTGTDRSGAVVYQFRFSGGAPRAGVQMTAETPAPYSPKPSVTITSTTSDGRSLAFDGEHLKITPRQNEKLRLSFKEADVASAYAEMDLYMDTHPERSYANHFAFARNWLQRSRNGRGGKNGTGNGNHKASGAVAAKPDKYKGRTVEVFGR